MGSQQWTVHDGQQWQRLAPSLWATAFVVFILLAGQAVLFLNSDPYWSALAFLSWPAIAITSIAMIRHAPGFSFGLAVVLAICDVQFFELLTNPSPLVAIVVVVYPAASALHARYLHFAWDRQARYADARAQTPIDLSHLPPARPAVRPRDVIEWTFGYWAALMVCLLIPGALGALEGADDKWEAAEAFGILAVLAIVPIAVVGWHDRWKESKAVAWLSSGSHRGLPVDLVVSSDRKVRLRVPHERYPFAAFVAREEPNHEPPAVPLEAPMPGTLFGDLRSRGWVAVATGGVLILPEGPLSTSDDELLPDRPNPDIVN